MSKADEDEAARRRRAMTMHVRHERPLASFVGRIVGGRVVGTTRTRAATLIVKPDAPRPADPLDRVVYFHQGEVTFAAPQPTDGTPWLRLDQRVAVILVPVPEEGPWPVPRPSSSRRLPDRWAEDVFTESLRRVLDPDLDMGAVGRSLHGLLRGLLRSMGELAVYAEPSSARHVTEGFVAMAMRMARLGHAQPAGSAWHKRFRSGLMTTLDDARRAGVDPGLPAQLFATLAMDVGQVGVELAGLPEGGDEAAAAARLWPLLLRCCAGAIAIARRAEAGLGAGS